MFTIPHILAILITIIAIRLWFYARRFIRQSTIDFYGENTIKIAFYAQVVIMVAACLVFIITT